MKETWRSNFQRHKTVAEFSIILWSPFWFCFTLMCFFPDCGSCLAHVPSNSWQSIQVLNLKILESPWFWQHLTWQAVTLHYVWSHECFSSLKTTRCALWSGLFSMDDQLLTSACFLTQSNQSISWIETCCHTQYATTARQTTEKQWDEGTEYEACLVLFEMILASLC